MAKQQQPTNELAPDYQQLFEASTEPMIVFCANHPHYTFSDVNEAHSAMTGVAKNKLVGQNFFEIFPDTSDQYRQTGVSQLLEDFKTIIATKKTLSSDVFRYDIKGKAGELEERYWKTVHTPICDGNGNVTHILQLSNDMTAEYLAEKQTRTMREQLHDALEIGKVGSWVWDVEEDIVIADRNLAKLFGLSHRETAHGLPLQTFTDVIHPQDRPRVIKSIQRAIRDKTPLDEEYRTITKAGKVKWVLARGKIEKHNGKVTFPGVIVDITERRELQAEVELARQQDVLNRQAAHVLQRRNDELESISRTKDEFVALASHQLRTPATAVKQYVGMVLQGYAGDISDIQKDMLDKAFESNERQIQIINQILNAARVDTGRLIMSTVALDLVDLVRGIGDEMKSSLEQRKHTFKVQLPRQPLQVRADQGYLRMAIENLVHNASIYTPDGGTIELGVTVHGQRAEIYVSDTGVGIKKADIKKLFAKFSRIHNPLSVQAGGSGIGLYLAAEIVRLHGGEVHVESVIHKGTTFAISLPVLDNTNGTQRSLP